MVSETLRLKIVDALKESELRRAWYKDLITACENEINRLINILKEEKE